MFEEKFIDRIEAFMKEMGLNNNQITAKAGLSNGLIGKARKKRGPMNSESIERILYSFPELNADWLMTGRGEMLIEKNQITDNKDSLTIYLKQQIKELQEKLKLERKEKDQLLKNIGALENENKNLVLREAEAQQGQGLSQSLSLLEIKKEKT